MPDNPVEGGLPPKVSPLKPITPPAAGIGSAPAPQKTVILKRPPVLRKVGEAASAANVNTAAPISAAPATAPAQAAPKIAPVTPAPVATGIAISHEQAAKRMTSRINLASATAQIPAVNVTAEDREAPTVKLRAPSPAARPAVSPAQNGELPPVNPNAPVMPSKSKTSRITMEAAFAAQPGLPPVSDAPKTIRLKRPTEMSGAPKVPTLKPPTTHVSIPPPPSRTAPIPAAAAPTDNVAPAPVPAPAPAPAPAGNESDDQAPTRRKTIKVKRPGANTGSGPKITLNKGETGENGEGDTNLQSLSSYDTGSNAPAAPDTANPGFIVAAVLAIIITANLIWVLASQAFGPNSALGNFARPVGPNIPDPPGVTVVE